MMPEDPNLAYARQQYLLSKQAEAGAARLMAAAHKLQRELIATQLPHPPPCAPPLAMASTPLAMANKKARTANAAPAPVARADVSSSSASGQNS